MKHKIRNRFVVIASGLLIVAASLGLVYMANRTIQKLPVRQYFPASSGTVKAVWDWSNPAKRSAGSINDLASRLSQRQINAVFLDIGSIVTATSPSGSQSSPVVTDSENGTFAAYISTMKAHGISVYAAAGETDWSQPANQAIPQHLLDYVHSYNSSHASADFAGLEFDIESYNQSGFATASADDQTRVLIDYLNMVSDLTRQEQVYDRKSTARFALGFTIPYWYDNENNNIPSVTWNGQTGPELYHLMDQLNTLDDSNVIVLAYRNAAAGSDGTIVHARTEVDYATVKAPRVKVIIGQETTNVQPPKITFYSHSLFEFSSQVQSIYSGFSKSGVFGGIATNDANGFLQLK